MVLPKIPGLLEKRADSTLSMTKKQRTHLDDANNNADALPSDKGFSVYSGLGYDDKNKKPDGGSINWLDTKREMILLEDENDEGDSSLVIHYRVSLVCFWELVCLFGELVYMSSRISL